MEDVEEAKSSKKRHRNLFDKGKKAYIDDYDDEYDDEDEYGDEDDYGGEDSDDDH